MNDPIEIAGIFKQSELPDHRKLWFDSRNPEYFEQFYRRLTGNETYSTISAPKSITREESSKRSYSSLMKTLENSTPLIGRPGYTTQHSQSCLSPGE